MAIVHVQRWRWPVAALALGLSACSSGDASSDGAAGAGGAGVGGSAGQAGAGAGGSSGAAAGTGGAPPVDCAPGDKDGAASGSSDESTAGGIRFIVRTPPDYDATRAHPLLVVLSPRVNNATPETLESFTGLTSDAAGRGYIVAYANWFDPVQAANHTDADTIRTLVADEWCVDAARVYYTGHSDGASVATLLATNGAPVAAVALSAAGIDSTNPPFGGCVAPVPAMVIHSADDEIFPPPEFGVKPADNWALCSSCGAPGSALPDGCVPYEGCVAKSEVQYCETTGSHYVWYGLNQSMLDFFDRHALEQ